MTAGVTISLPSQAATACSTAALITDINTANGSSGTVTLTSPCTYTLTAANNTTDGGTGLPVITGNVTIQGSGDTITTTASTTAPFRIFDVAVGGSLTLNDLTLSNGLADDGVNGGGAIFSHGSLTVTSVTFSDNSSPSSTGTSGGAINSAGPLSVSNSTFTGNTAQEGGGIFNESSTSTATVTDSTFSGNTAASGNTATIYGGGALTSADGTTNLTGDTFSGDDATGTAGGGAIDNDATLNISDSTFNGDTAGTNGGGAIINFGTTTITQATFSGNSSQYGANILNYTGDTLKISMSIVANGQGGGPNCGGGSPVTDAGYNIDTGTSCGFSTANHSMSNTNPLLDPLASNGGPTQTMALPSGSPAVDAIPATTPGCTGTTDQRGITRPQGTGCDIGAYELVQTGNGTPSVPTGLISTGTTSGSVSLSWTASTGNPTGYTVYRNGKSVGTTGGPSATTFTDNTVSPFTTYSYTVDAFSGSNHSGPSLPVQVTTPTPGGTAAVQSGSVSTGSAVTSTTITLSSPVHAGDLLVGWFGQFNASGQVTVSDSVNGTWTRSTASTTWNSGAGDLALYYFQDSAAAPYGLTITISASSATYLDGAVAEYSGVATSGALDQVAVAKGVGTTPNSGSTTAVGAGELVVGGIITGTSPGTVTAGTSQGQTFTMRAQSSSGSADLEDILSGAAGAQDAAATFSASTDWYAVVATFHAFGTPNLPSPWTDADVGAPVASGSASYSGGVFTVNGSGSDIWGSTDQFNYVSQPLTGNGSIVARVTSQTNTNAWAKSGVMIKQSTTAGTAYALLAVTPGNGVTFQSNFNTSVAGGSYTFPNAWLKLTRTGGTITAYTSPDGSTWTQVGTATVSLTDPVTIGLFTCSHSADVLNTATFDNVTVASLAVPSPWADADVGAPAVAGSATYSGGAFTVNGSGSDIWGSTDQFNYVSQPLTGNGSIVAQVTSQTNTNAWAKSGVMIKQSTTAGTAYALLAVTPSNGITFQYGFNTSVAGPSYTFPNAWLELTRSGSTITAYTSPDGSTWTQVGTTTISLTDPVTIGLFTSSHNSSALNTATFDNVTVASLNVPSPWADADVGAPAVAGSATYAGGVFTVNGSGSDIWGSTDQFNYVSQPLTGNGTIVARVTSQTNTDPWAKSGVMIKQSTTAGTAYALLAVTPGNGTTFQYGFNGSVAGGSYTFPNAWLKLTRTGGTIIAYTSPDGSTWTEVGYTTISLTNPVTIGLFTCAHNSGALNTTTFDNVTVTSGAPSLPSPWADADVGAPAVAGSATYAGGVFTVNGSGSDIWGSTDQFNYVSQPLTGNGTIVARVTSQTNTDPWAKSGVMIKQSTTAGTAYALLAVTPGNGITFQFGFNNSVAGGSYTFPNGWLKLSISGSTITAYTSPNGSTWTEVGTTTISLTDPVTIGLFTCAHNPSALNTTTFDNVSVTSP
ncbi:MAG: beta strand repeat-containing protein [Streptosporangiaceae bacterium]